MILMENNKENPDKENKDSKGIDPIQLLIWGILLVAYGLYSTYRTANSGIESNLLYILMPNIILTIFGFIMILVGYRREKESKVGKT